MLKDMCGRRIKNNLNGFQQAYMGQFYIYNNKIFEIIRINTQRKLNGKIVNITFRNAKTHKMFSKTITLDGFEKRKHFKTLRSAEVHLVHLKQ